MNYISEINSFYDWLETNQVPKSAIALWHSLMHIGNKARWTPSFAVAISTIESKTGFKRSELFEARNILQQKGRLKWIQRGGNLSAEYIMIPFCVHIADAKAYASTDAKANTNPTQKHTINKQNKSKLNETSKSHSGKPVKKNELIFWKGFIAQWNEWYLAKTGESYNYQAKDFSHLKKIYQFLEKRAQAKKFEFTEENLLAAFKFFLNKAWEKDEWLRQNFSIPNILSQFNQIANGKSDSKSGKQPTGASVNTGSILSRINAMPD